MKIEITSLTDKAIEERGGDILKIKINGKKVFSVYDGEPEDNTLGRNFNDCYKLENIFTSIYQAVITGEESEIISSQVDEI